MYIIHAPLPKDGTGIRVHSAPMRQGVNALRYTALSQANANGNLEGWTVTADPGGRRNESCRHCGPQVTHGGSQSVGSLAVRDVFQGCIWRRSGDVHDAGGGSCFSSVFWACVRIVWKGFAANSGVAKIIGMRMRSTCLQEKGHDVSFPTLPHKQSE